MSRKSSDSIQDTVAMRDFGFAEDKIPHLNGSDAARDGPSISAELSDPANGDQK